MCIPKEGLKINNLIFTYPANNTEYCFNLNVLAGKITAITGKSGAGKSTLFDLIAGFLSPKSGQIKWNEKSILNLLPEKRPLTILFQKNNLFDHMSVWENISIGINPTMRLSSWQQRQINLALDKVGLTSLAHRQADSLSGGQQQRVALARSLVRERPILLLDEPFNGLDKETRIEMLSLIRSIADHDNRCILFTTHNLQEQEYIADSHYNIREGYLYAE